MLAKLKNLVKNNGSDIFIVLTVILVALISFGIGRLSAPKSEPILIKNLEQGNVEQLMSEQSISAPTDAGTTADKGKVVGSKNSDKYHTGYTTILLTPNRLYSRL
jgi:hypothetical protein